MSYVEGVSFRDQFNHEHQLSLSPTPCGSRPKPRVLSPTPIALVPEEVLEEILEEILEEVDEKVLLTQP